MARKEEKVYVIVPIPGKRGDEEEYVAIDKDRFDPHTLRLVQRLPGKGGTQYVPFATARQLKSELQPPVEEIPHDAVLAVLDECIASWTYSLRACGDVGIHTANTVEHLDIAELIRALLARNIRKSSEALRGILSAFESLTCGLAEQLCQKHTALEGVSATVAELSETLDLSSGVAERVLGEWADAAKKLNAAAEHLIIIEEKGKKLRGMIDETRNLVEGIFYDPNDSVYLEARGFLGGDTQYDGWVIIAARFQKNPSSYALQQVHDALAIAKNHIAARRKVDVEVSTYWQENVSIYRKEILMGMSKVGRLKESIEAASRKLADFELRFRDEGIRPFDQRVGQLISIKEYALAQQRLRDSAWAPRICGPRIEGLLQTLLDQIENLPTHPVSFQRLITESEAAIATMTSILEERPRSAVLSSHTTSIPPAITSTPSTRTDEIYELFLCVGYALTCQPLHFAQSHVHAMLEIMFYLKKITLDEVSSMVDDMRKRILCDEEREIVHDKKNVHARWVHSEKSWVSFKLRGMWRIKMTVCGGKHAAPLLKKHHLTVEKIKLAQQARRDNAKIQHGNRKIENSR